MQTESLFITGPRCAQIHTVSLLFLSLLPVGQKAESNEQRQNGLKMVDQAIWSKKMSNGVRRTPVSAEQVCIKT